MKRNSARAHGIKFEENLFFCQIYVIFVLPELSSGRDLVIQMSVCRELNFT